MSINQENKTITIRWHAIRPYKKDEIVGMRGYPETDGTQRYELSFNGSEWEAHHVHGNKDHTGVGYEPYVRLILRYKDLFAVIKKCEEHAYELWHQEQDDFDPQWEYVQQFEPPSEHPDTYNENWDLDD